MSAAEMREALKPCPFCGGEATYCADHTTECVDSISCRRCDFYMSDPELEQGSVIAAWNRRAPLPDEEGMVERMARAMCFAWHYAKPRTPDGEAEWTRERSRLMAQSRAALHVVNGGAEGGEARQHIEALLSLHIAHHNNPIHGAARAFLSKMEAK